MQQQTFWLPKRGNDVADYEDAFAAEPATGRFAVADGATESSFAREWARLLAAEFVHSPIRPTRRWTEWLPSVQARWKSDVGSQPLPWFAEAKFAQGAFATFLGLALNSDRRQHWHAVAIGDSCLFQIRDGRLNQAFPLTQSVDFDNSPRLLGSRTSAAEARQREVRGRGDWQSGDSFFLATDALAQWFLSQVEGDGQPWELFESLFREPDVRHAGIAWIDQLRDRHEIRNDDVTLIMVTV